MSGFYLFITSNDCSDIFPSNTWNDFTIEFPQEIRLSNCLGTAWSFALTEIALTNTSQSPLSDSWIVLCDLAESSYIRGSTAPVLRTISQDTEKSGSLFQTYYIGVNNNKFNRLRIYIRNSELKPLNSSIWQATTITKLTLHFQKV